MAKAAPVAIIDCAGIVICVVEEPVCDAACAGAEAFETFYSKDAVSPDEGQPKEVVAKFLAKHSVQDPDNEHSALERVSIPDQVVEHAGGNSR